ncbi:guanine nucleotide exchange factor MSS4 [Dryobates pubescens]|uniref:guanine nucleotide exchange factor MSS4 n=1 Tax=Dryobates pubescens TaxID=118200 RepID=UPI0023B8BAFB|nr:guanine nucleotide exchange factor MSS4 [Dryobates pubescens]
MAATCAGMEPPAASPPSPPSPAPPAAARGSAELVCAQGRNLKAVLCQRCGSRVLLPGAATFARRELLLPAMRKKAAAAAGGGGDVVREHWLVRDMFSFENVGFTRDVGNVKFLVCADCEAGPIGWHCLDDKDSFYVALERVAHE